MTFHDARGMLDMIAKWLESYDIEADWEAIMQSKWWVGPEDWVPPSKWSMPQPFPGRLTPQLATKLLFAQWWNRLQIGPEVIDPIDDPESAQRGGEGVEDPATGKAPSAPVPWENFLRQLAAIDRIEIVELKLHTPEERKQLVHMAMLEEELAERARLRNCERVNRQNRGEAASYISRKSIPTLWYKANRGNREAQIELGRRNLVTPEILEKWQKRYERNAEIGRQSHKYMRTKKNTEKIDEAESGEEPIGIERELEVIRVGPNPRILVCRYKELAEERTCSVRVKTIANFLKGMKFKMREPVGEKEYKEAWEYVGPMPRRKGKW